MFLNSLVIFSKNADLQTAVKECYWLFILTVVELSLNLQKSREVHVNWTVQVK